VEDKDSRFNRDSYFLCGIEIALIIREIDVFTSKKQHSYVEFWRSYVELKIIGNHVY